MDQAPSAGPAGVAVAPPAYGLNSIDHGLSESQAGSGAITQRQTDLANIGGNSGVRSENKTGLPDKMKTRIESLSGLALDNVRVHYNSPRPAQLQALAYTQGTEIHVAPGQERHLPHEAWHIVQQAQGRVRPTTQLKGGVAVNDDNGLEHEADVMGARANDVHMPINTSARVPAYPMPKIVQRRKIQSDWQYFEYVDDDEERIEDFLEEKWANLFDKEDVENIRTLRADRNAALPYPRKEHVSDEEIRYGEPAEDMRSREHILTKPKVLYANPSIRSPEIAHLAARRALRLIGGPNKANKWSRSWARVKAKVGDDLVEGYINTQAALEHKPLVHSDLGNVPIMPEDGPKPEHVEQNMLPSCFLLAALMSLTRNYPDYSKDSNSTCNNGWLANTGRHEYRFER